MSEKSKNSAYGKSSLPLIGVGFIVLLLFWACLGINLGFGSSAIAFEIAQNKWETSNIRDYEMIVSFYSMVYITDVLMLVEDNQVVSMTELGWVELGDHRAVPIDLSQDPSWYTGTFGFSSFLAPSLQDYEAGKLFEFTETILPVVPLVSLCTSEIHYELAFNQEYGFVEEINYTNCPSWDVGLGLLCPVVSDCQAGFRVTEFVPHSK